MPRRRACLVGLPCLAAAPLWSVQAAAQGTSLGAGQAGGFDALVDSVKQEARRAGVSPTTLARAFAGVRANDRVLELDRRQPEGALSWEQYRDRIVSPARIDNGRRQAAENRTLLAAIGTRFRVAPGVVLAIWGMETNYGANTGGFGTVEALATLAWDGRRSGYFRGELIAALRILEGGHVTPERMRGSWAGAMGQPQFMPSNFERLAVDFDGDGRRDIWDSRADALASIAHYLARSGWREAEPWGQAVLAPPGFTAEAVDPELRRPVRDWGRLGFRRADGGALVAAELDASLIQPRNPGPGQFFLVHQNFRAIRRYNPPVNYALAVGLLSDRVA